MLISVSIGYIARLTKSTLYPYSNSEPANWQVHNIRLRAMCFTEEYPPSVKLVV